jgi:hypothetical protein
MGFQKKVTTYWYEHLSQSYDALGQDVTILACHKPINENLDDLPSVGDRKRKLCQCYFAINKLLLEL